MDILIRELKTDERSILDSFLYKAIYHPDPLNKISKDILQVPEIKVYTDDFGLSLHDYCLIAEYNQSIIGAVWIRILSGNVKGYGNIDDHTPEIAISVIEQYRNKGIGYRLMQNFLNNLAYKGYKQVSLSVNKQNYAYKMYKKLGFEIIEERHEDYLMLLNL